MILITSAAYVEREFQIEFGPLPPAFLPVGNLRLFELQIDALRAAFPDERVVLTVPVSSNINSRDSSLLDSLDIEVIRQQEGIALGRSVQLSVEDKIKGDCNLRILHGDTLITDISKEFNSIGLGTCDDSHSWEIDDQNATNDLVWCGYFSFRYPKEFMECISSSGGDFVGAVRCYDAKFKLTRSVYTNWFDFGHISTYFQSRSKLTTQRSFNSLQMSKGSVVKSGMPLAKIKAEYGWFKNLNDELLVYAPQLTRKKFGSKNLDSYQIEYLPLPPLNEVFVHGRNGERYWEKIFSRLDEFLTICQQQPIPPSLVDDLTGNAQKLVLDKTISRLSEFSVKNPTIDLKGKNKLNGIFLPSVYQIVDDCCSRISFHDCVFGVSHGDLCLSNILFDSRTQRIKVIDPRGLDFFGAESIFGDLRYDLAKLTHSILGLYDHIIAGAYKLSIERSKAHTAFDFEIHNDEAASSIQSLYRSKTFLSGISYKDVMPQTILLFFSMLPLHSDNPDRQMAFFANALRLYSEMILE